jgi:hypothetical protein
LEIRAPVSWQAFPWGGSDAQDTSVFEAELKVPPQNESLSG